MLSYLLAIGLLALSVSAQDENAPPLYGGQCELDGFMNCMNQGAQGCVQLAGPNCVDQTHACDAQCNFTGYTYQKDQSDDRTCICTLLPAGQPIGGFPPPPDTPPLRGGQCDAAGLQHCQVDQAAWGCVLIEGGGPNCVDQTSLCDEVCGGVGFAYQKDMSDDHTCICTDVDASQSVGVAKVRRGRRA